MIVFENPIYIFAILLIPLKYLIVVKDMRGKIKNLGRMYPDIKS